MSCKSGKRPCKLCAEVDSVEQSHLLLGGVLSCLLCLRRFWSLSMGGKNPASIDFFIVSVGVSATGVSLLEWDLEPRSHIQPSFRSDLGHVAGLAPIFTACMHPGARQGRAWSQGCCEASGAETHVQPGPRRRPVAFPGEQVLPGGAGARGAGAPALRSIPSPSRTVRNLHKPRRRTQPRCLAGCSSNAESCTQLVIQWWWWRRCLSPRDHHRAA